MFHRIVYVISKDLINNNDIPDPDNLMNEEELSNDNDFTNINKINDHHSQNQTNLLDYFHCDQDMDIC